MTPNRTFPVYKIQHADIAAGRKTFEHSIRLFPNALTVRSEFSTVQGEGPFAGQYAYFIRLGGCNYGPKTSHCQFCDTDFTLADSQIRSFSGLAEAWSNERCNLVVMTGGEPTLQANVVDLCVKYPNIHFQFETNGTQTAVIHQLLDLSNVTVVISPKYSQSGALLEPTDKMLEQATFKFLVSADPDSYEYSLPEFAFRTSKPIYLSPIAVYKKPYQGEVVSAWDPEVIDQPATALNYSHAAHQVKMMCKYIGGRKVILNIQQHIFTNIP